MTDIYTAFWNNALVCHNAGKIMAVTLHFFETNLEPPNYERQILCEYLLLDRLLGFIVA